MTSRWMRFLATLLSGTWTKRKVGSSRGPPDSIQEVSRRPANPIAAYSLEPLGSRGRPNAADQNEPTTRRRSSRRSRRRSVPSSRHATAGPAVSRGPHAMGSEAGVGTQINLPAAHQKPRGSSLSRCSTSVSPGGSGPASPRWPPPCVSSARTSSTRDVVAREVVEPGRPTLAAVAERFGAHLIRPDGSLDRPALAAIVFPDPAALADLDRITGPAITARVRELRAASDVQAVSVYDMPLLVERRLWPHEHLSVVVGADTETRVRRLVDQRGLDEADARHRIARQATDEERRAAADVWVDNDGDRRGHPRSGPCPLVPPARPLQRELADRQPRSAPDRRLVVDPTRRGPPRPPACRPRCRRPRRPGGPRRAHRLDQRPRPGGQGRRRPPSRRPPLADADAPGFVADLTQRGLVRVPAITADTPLTPRPRPERVA